MNYQLKSGFNPISFLKTVDRCTGEVLFVSRKGTRLDLKSRLSKVLFLTLRPGDSALRDSKVECSDADGERLSEFLVIPE